MPAEESLMMGEVIKMLTYDYLLNNETVASQLEFKYYIQYSQRIHFASLPKVAHYSRKPLTQNEHSMKTKTMKPCLTFNRFPCIHQQLSKPIGEYIN